VLWFADYCRRFGWGIANSRAATGLFGEAKLNRILPGPKEVLAARKCQTRIRRAGKYCTVRYVANILSSVFLARLPSLDSGALL